MSMSFVRVPWGDNLITSHREQASRLGISIRIEVMDENEAVELLRKCSHVDEASDDALVWRMARALGYPPDP